MLERNDRACLPCTVLASCRRAASCLCEISQPALLEACARSCFSVSLACSHASYSLQVQHAARRSDARFHLRLKLRCRNGVRRKRQTWRSKSKQETSTHAFRLRMVAACSAPGLVSATGGSGSPSARWSSHRPASFLTSCTADSGSGGGDTARGTGESMKAACCTSTGSSKPCA